MQITWRATRKEAYLAGAHCDEFVLRGQAAAKPGPLWFQVRQLCAKGGWTWAEIPASGTSTKGLKAPAVLPDVVADQTAQ